MPVRRVAGLTPNSAGAGNPQQPIYSNSGDGGKGKVTHVINLDADELFGQFCAYANLVRLGPRRGVFLSTIPIVESKQGWMRVWRYWLVDRARELYNNAEKEEMLLSRRPTLACPDVGGDSTVLWTDDKKNVGLRFSVKCLDPKLYEGKDDLEDIPLGFQVEITGKPGCFEFHRARADMSEMVVRTTHLMLAVEATMAGKGAPSGKTLIFGAFAVAGQPEDPA